MDDTSSVDGLANVLRALRTELDAAQQQLADSAKEPLLFLKGAEVELAFTVEKSASGKGGVKFKVWGLSIGSDGEVARKSTVVHRIRIELEPGSASAGAQGTPTAYDAIDDRTTAGPLFYFSPEKGEIIIRDRSEKRRIGILSRPKTGNEPWSFDPDPGHCRYFLPGMFPNLGGEDPQ